MFLIPYVACSCLEQVEGWMRDEEEHPLAPDLGGTMMQQQHTNAGYVRPTCSTFQLRVEPARQPCDHSQSRRRTPIHASPIPIHARMQS